VAERRGSLIDNAWLVRVLANSPHAHDCSECGARMFVRAESGLCPVCFTDRRLREEQIETVVDSEAGRAVQDWSPGR
jgi:hypothetical protein